MGLLSRPLYCRLMFGLQIIETDGEGRVSLPGHPCKRFLLRKNADDSILLQPARAVTETQYEYDNTLRLRELLTAASSSPTVRKLRHRRERHMGRQRLIPGGGAASVVLRRRMPRGSR